MNMDQTMRTAVFWNTPGLTLKKSRSVRRMSRGHRADVRPSVRPDVWRNSRSSSRPAASTSAANLGCSATFCASLELAMLFPLTPTCPPTAVPTRMSTIMHDRRLFPRCRTQHPCMVLQLWGQHMVQQAMIEMHREPWVVKRCNRRGMRQILPQTHLSLSMLMRSRTTPICVYISGYEALTSCSPERHGRGCPAALPAQL